jgi:hypothetical protein
MAMTASYIAAWTMPCKTCELPGGRPSAIAVWAMRLQSVTALPLDVWLAALPSMLWLAAPGGVPKRQHQRCRDRNHQCSSEQRHLPVDPGPAASAPHRPRHHRARRPTRHWDARGTGSRAPASTSASRSDRWVRGRPLGSWKTHPRPSSIPTSSAVDQPSHRRRCATPPGGRSWPSTFADPARPAHGSSSNSQRAFRSVTRTPGSTSATTSTCRVTPGPCTSSTSEI